jgi:hypothetical protein
MPSAKGKKRKELAEFQDEERYHRREWRTQRLGWAVLAAVLVAACAGLFGSGPMAVQKVAVGDSTLEFDRFVRRRAAAEWKLQPAPTAAAGDEVVVRIASRFLEKFELKRIVPEPTSSALAGEQTVFRFDASNMRGAIVFHVEPEDFGTAAGSFEVGEGSAVTLAQFIYP